MAAYRGTDSLSIFGTVVVAVHTRHSAAWELTLGPEALTDLGLPYSLPRYLNLPLPTLTTLTYPYLRAYILTTLT